MYSSTPYRTLACRIGPLRPCLSREAQYRPPSVGYPASIRHMAQYRGTLCQARAERQLAFLRGCCI